MARILLAKARFDLENGSLVPPLGAMYIASVLRQAGHHVGIFDQRQELDLNSFLVAVRDFRPDYIGFSAITYECQVMEEMATAARRSFTNIPIIVGGAHASAYPERCARHPAIDYVVLGEGESTIVELIDVLEHGGDLSSVAGLAYARPDGEVHFTAERPAIEDVDSIPFPAWDLIDINFYAGMPRMSQMGRQRYMPLFTSRGCPFKCTYCHEVQGKRFRARSPENVLAEMRTLREEYGVNDFEVIDDIFNFDRDRMLEILDHVAALTPRPQLHFPNALRTDILDEAQIKALRRAGTTSLSVAVESVTPRLQKLTRKHLKIDRVRENIRIAVREGMFVRGFFMLGFPTETYEEARATVDFALQSELHQALFFLVTPFAGTELYEKHHELVQQRGIDVAGPNGSYQLSRHNLSAMTDRELYGLHREAYLRFYADPVRAIRVLRQYPQWGEILTTYAKSFIRMLFNNRSVREAKSARIPAPVETPRRPVPRLRTTRLPVLSQVEPGIARFPEQAAAGR